MLRILLSQKWSSGKPIMRSVVQIPLSQDRWEQYMEAALAAVVGVTVVVNLGSSGLIVSAGSNSSSKV